MIKRYFKGLYWPEENQVKLAGIVEHLNAIQWKLSKHSIERLIQKTDDLNRAGQFIKGYALKEAEIFEYYQNNHGFIFKVCFSIRFNDTENLKIVVNTEDKSIITIFFNHVLDTHKTLDKSIYTLQAV